MGESDCIYCKKEATVSFKQKHVCDDCFDDLLDFAYHGKVTRILSDLHQKLTKEIYVILDAEKALLKVRK